MMNNLKNFLLQREKMTTASIICATVAFVVVVAIYCLTEQLPDTTSSESNAFNAFLVSLLGDTPLYNKETNLWLGIDIRHWAHSAEFFLLGIFVTLTIWFNMNPKLIKTVGISFAVCAVLSLMDQFHKLFVPGRHFDMFDLAMDTLGYGIAILIVLLTATIFTMKVQQSKIVN